jgi:pimeloyl-ACP methyl ester carboxylesterase
MPMATFVLVHGAWLGGWVWGRVAADLRARGHTVYAPTLTGLGERVHLLDDDVDLEFHATDVCNTLEFEDAQRAILVGHGYGGAVVQRVAARMAERVGRLFFLDALLAPDGASLFDALGPANAAALRARVADEDGVAVLQPDLGLLLDGLAKRDADWVEDRLAPMPARPYEERPALAAFFALDRPTAYVKCQRGDPAASVDLARARGWTVHEIDGGHLPMIARPAPTAELLDNFARQPATHFARAES